MNSFLLLDWCGVCGGDNSTCEISSGGLTERQHWGYSDVVIIPEGAARIEITQRAFHDKADDDNYLGKGMDNTREYSLLLTKIKNFVKKYAYDIQKIFHYFLLKYRKFYCLMLK